MKLKDYPHTDAMVIETNVAGWTATKIRVDTGSSADILFATTFDSMKLNKNLLQPAGNPLWGFGGQQVRAIGKIALPITFGDQKNYRTEQITFDVVDMYYNYNAIFGRGVTNAFSAAVHPGYLCMKLPTPKGIIAVYGDQDCARLVEGTANPGQINVHSLDKKQPKPQQAEENKEEPSKAKPAKEIKRINLLPNNPSKQVIISSTPTEKDEEELVQFLHDNSDIFAWLAEELRGVDRSLIEHNLNINPAHQPVNQKL